MSQGQEVRTIFTWDTTDVDKGVQRMERAMERVKRGEDDLQRKSAHSQGGSNFAMGIRDLAEGRGVNALQRFGHSIGATTTRLALYMVAAKAAGSAISYLNQELTKYDANARVLEKNFQTTDRRGTFATSAMSPTEILAAKSQNIEAQKAENEQQGGLQFMADAMKAMRTASPSPMSMLNPAAWAFSLMQRGSASTIDAFRGFTGKRSPEQEQAASEERERKLAGNTKKYNDLYEHSLSRQVEIAKLGAPGEQSDPFEAKRKELELAKEMEVTQAKILGAGDKETRQIEERYLWLKKSIDAEDIFAEHRYNSARRIQEIEQKGQSKYSTALQTLSARGSSAEMLLKSGTLDQKGEREQKLELGAVYNQRRDVLAKRYLKEDGTQRNPADVQRDFLKDAAEDRARGHFQKLYDAGGFDPKTGRRRATAQAIIDQHIADAPGKHGLSSGHLATGHLVTGHLSSSGLSTGGLGEGFHEMIHPAPSPSAKNESQQHHKSIDDLYSLIDQRLPKK